jgi:hypothetical protein
MVTVVKRAVVVERTVEVVIEVITVVGVVGVWAA